MLVLTFLSICVFWHYAMANCNLGTYAAHNCEVPAGTKSCSPIPDVLDASSCDTYIVSRGASLEVVSFVPPRKVLVIAESASFTLRSDLALQGSLILQSGSMLMATSINMSNRQAAVENSIVVSESASLTADSMKINGSKFVVEPGAVLKIDRALEVSSVDVLIAGEVVCSPCAIHALDLLSVASHGSIRSVLPPSAAFVGDFVWVESSTPNHAHACRSLGLQATDTNVAYSWSPDTCNDVAGALGMVCGGLQTLSFNHPSMWCASQGVCYTGKWSDTFANMNGEDCALPGSCVRTCVPRPVSINSCGTLLVNGSVTVEGQILSLLSYDFGGIGTLNAPSITVHVRDMYDQTPQVVSDRVRIRPGNFSSLYSSACGQTKKSRQSQVDIKTRTHHPSDALALICMPYADEQRDYRRAWQAMSTKAKNANQELESLNARYDSALLDIQSHKLRLEGELESKKTTAASLSNATKENDACQEKHKHLLLEVRSLNQQLRRLETGYNSELADKGQVEALLKTQLANKQNEYNGCQDKLQQLHASGNQDVARLQQELAALKSHIHIERAKKQTGETSLQRMWIELQQCQEMANRSELCSNDAMVRLAKQEWGHAEGALEGLKQHHNSSGICGILGLWQTLVAILTLSTMVGIMFTSCACLNLQCRALARELSEARVIASDESRKHVAAVARYQRLEEELDTVKEKVGGVTTSLHEEQERTRRCKGELEATQARLHEVQALYDIYNAQFNTSQPVKSCHSKRQPEMHAMSEAAHSEHSISVNSSAAWVKLRDALKAPGSPYRAPDQLRPPIRDDGPKCFLPNTAFKAPGGQLALVQNLEIGSIVLLHDGGEARVASIKCYPWRKKEPYDLCTLVTAQGHFEVSVSHNIATATGARHAGDLQIGDKVIVGAKEQPLLNVTHKKARTNLFMVSFDPPGCVEAFPVPSRGLQTFGEPGPAEDAPADDGHQSLPSSSPQPLQLLQLIGCASVTEEALEEALPTEYDE